MPQINSVYGQLVGVPVGQTYVAGPGITIDNVNKTVSVDETVLWESNVSNGETSATLSESIYNFESVRIFYRAGERYGVWLSVEVMNRDISSGGIRLVDWFINSPDTAIIMGTANYSVSNNGLTLTGSQLHHLWFSLSNFSYSGQGTAGVYIKKVVGINRIQSA